RDCVRPVPSPTLTTCWARFALTSNEHGRSAVGVRREAWGVRRGAWSVISRPFSFTGHWPLFSRHSPLFTPIVRPPSYRQRLFAEHDLDESSGSAVDAACVVLSRPGGSRSIAPEPMSA